MPRPSSSLTGPRLRSCATALLKLPVSLLPVSPGLLPSTADLQHRRARGQHVVAGLRRPVRGGRDPLQTVVRDQVGVLRLGPAAQARVPPDRCTGPDRLGRPAGIPLAGPDLQLALRVPDRAALVVARPGTRVPGRGVPAAQPRPPVAVPAARPATRE